VIWLPGIDGSFQSVVATFQVSGTVNRLKSAAMMVIEFREMDGNEQSFAFSVYMLHFSKSHPPKKQ